MTLLTEQRVAAVTGSEALDREFLGKMHDEATLRVEIPGGMQPFHEFAVMRDALERRTPHACHELHIEHHVRTIGDFDAASRKR